MNNPLDPDSIALEDRDFILRVTRYLDDEMDEAEFAVFQDELRGNPDRQTLFFQLSGQEVLLHQCGEGMLEQRKRPVWQLDPKRLRIAAIASIAALVVIGFSLKVMKPEAKSPIGVQLVGVAGAQFEQLPQSEFLSTVDLHGGTAEFATLDGGRLTIDGPTRFTMTAPNEITLEYGRLFIDLEDPASSIRVVTRQATFVDIGTSFGLAAYPDHTELHVLSGEVAVLPIDQHDLSTAVARLKANEAVAIRHLENSTGMTSMPANSSAFVRTLPSKIRIPVQNTGIAGGLGDIDTRWAMIELPADIGSDLQRAAVVSHTAYEPNIPGTSQWLSNEYPLTSAPKSGKYLFRTVFDLHGVMSDTAVLSGRFWVDNYVASIRLNGVEQPVPKQDDTGLNHHPGKEVPFIISTGFTNGANILEFEVVNRILDGTKTNPLAFRCEIAGEVSVIQDPSLARQSEALVQPLQIQD